MCVRERERGDIYLIIKVHTHTDINRKKYSIYLSIYLSVYAYIFTDRLVDDINNLSTYLSSFLENIL